MKRALAVVFLLITTFVAARAEAQRVVLVRPPSTDLVLTEAFNRLRAELSLQEFEVIVLPRAEVAGDSPAVLEEAARRAGAFAGISLSRRVGTTAAEVCVADRVTGKVSLRTLALREARDAPSVLAVRAVDLLRASLREFDPGERPPPDVVGLDAKPVPEEVRQWSAEEPPVWQLRASGALLTPGGDFGLAYGAGLALHRRLTRDFSVGVTFVGPLVGADLETTGGTATLRQELGLVAARLRLLGSGILELNGALGLGAYHLAARGEVNPPLTARSDDVVSFAGALGVEADLRIASRVLLGLGARVVLLTPRPAVAVGEEQSSFDVPLLTADLGLGVEF